MSDKRLKIRIQIKKLHRTKEQTHAKLPELEVIYEQCFNWKKIFLAALLLISILVLVYYFFIKIDQSNVRLNQKAPTFEQVTPTQQSKTALEAALGAIGKQKSINMGSRVQLEHSDPTNLMAPKDNVQSEQIIKWNELITTSEIKSKDVLNLKKKIILPRKKPQAMLQLVPSKISDHPQVLRAQLSQTIKEREPVDSINAIYLYPNESKPIYFYLHLKDLQGKKINIVWYRNNMINSKLSLGVHSNNWRTYASKQLNFQRIGAWRVELFDESGNLLARRNFTVTQY